MSNEDKEAKRKEAVEAAFEKIWEDFAWGPVNGHSEEFIKERVQLRLERMAEWLLPDEEEEPAAPTLQFRNCNCMRWYPLNAHWPSCPSFNPDDEYGRSSFALNVDPKLVQAIAASVCACVFCTEAKRPRPLHQTDQWNWMVASADLALTTVGTPITNCTNNIWCVAVDRVSEHEPKRPHESQEDWRGRLATLIKKGVFIRKE